MQGLSSRAHAFSVEALVGKKPCKLRKVSGGHDVSLAAEARTDTDTLNGRSQLYAHRTNKGTNAVELAKQLKYTCIKQ